MSSWFQSPVLRRLAGWRGWWPLALLSLGLWGPPGSAFAASTVERFPPPEFDSGYQMPTLETPPPRSVVWEWMDVAMLLATLSLATYFVLGKRSRKHVFYLMLFSLLYFGFYREGCVCAIGAIQNVTLALFDRGYAVPLTVLAFFLLPLLFTLVFGRGFCAAVCPLGAIQDVVLVRPVKVRPWLEQALGVIPYLYLGAAVLLAATGSAFIICEYDPFVSFFRRSGTFGKLALGAAFLLVGLFIGRPYCRFFCPYGALLRWLSRFARWNVTLTPDDCLHCQLCEVACPFGAIREPSATTVSAAPAVPAAPAGPAPVKVKRPTWRYAALLPVLVVAGAWLGHQLSTPLSRLHATVKLAERIAAEESGHLSPPEDLVPAEVPSGVSTATRHEATLRQASKAFRASVRPTESLYADALRLRREFAWGGALLGAFVGLIFGARLLALAAPPPPRDAFEPDPANCVACARCYQHCPKEIVRQKRLARHKVIPLTPA